MSHSAENAVRLAAHERLVTALLTDPAALDTPPSLRARLQTSISSLVLAGNHVFKLRKPLQLDYLDFSTPARRRVDCEEELRLNRRTAPEIYLEVRPVTGTPDAPRIGGDPAAAIDWALCMRRFDDALRLDRLADQGQLAPALIDALAQTVARFHAGLPPSPPEFGQPSTVRQGAIDNFDTLAEGPPIVAAATARLQALRHWTEQEFERLAPLLAERRREGRVREGHGDLHLGNIVLIEGRPVLFDGLEFNPALRHIDVMADLAFLFMDLQRHALPSSAWRLIDAYSEHSGDHAGLASLRFFAVYRAMVRAKVAALRMEQHDAQASAAFARDLALAERLRAEPAGAPRLVVTSGVSGSGKSTVAQMLVESLGAVRLRSDVERKRLFGMAPTARPDARQSALLYGQAATRRTYDRLASLAATLLDAGLHTIVDAACLKRDERERLRAVAAAQGARFTLIECHAPEAVLRERVGRRLAADHDASDADLAVLDLQLRQRMPVGDDEQPQRIDTALGLDELRATLRQALGIA